MMSLWYSLYAAAAAAKLLQSCLTLCDPVGGSPPGSAIPGILHARTLEWVAIAFSDSLYECTIIYVINLYFWAFRFDIFPINITLRNILVIIFVDPQHVLIIIIITLNSEFSTSLSDPPHLFFFPKEKKHSLAKSIGIRFPDLWELQARDGKFCLFSEKVFFLVL